MYFPISENSACPVSMQMNVLFAGCWLKWKSECVHECLVTFLKENLKGWQNIFPLSVQLNSLSSCLTSEPLTVSLKERMNLCMNRSQEDFGWAAVLEADAPGEPLPAPPCLRFRILSHWYSGNRYSWDFPWHWRKNAVLDDNRPASVEGHNVISHALPRHLGKGLGVKSREGRG